MTQRSISCNWGRIGVWCLSLVLACPHNTAWAADPVRVHITWQDLEPLVRGEHVRIETADGVSLEGRAIKVDQDSLVVEVRRSSKPGVYPKGRASVERSSVARIKVIRYIGNGRKIGKTIGGAAGLAAGLTGAVAIGFEENPDTAGRRKVAIALLIPGAIIGGLLAGWLLGRAADREVTLIEIIPR